MSVWPEEGDLGESDIVVEDSEPKNTMPRTGWPSFILFEF